MHFCNSLVFCAIFGYQKTFPLNSQIISYAVWISWSFSYLEKVYSNPKLKMTIKKQFFGLKDESAQNDVCVAYMDSEAHI